MAKKKPTKKVAKKAVKKRKKINSRSKGGRGERELSKELTKLFGAACRRGQQYCGIEGQDVVGLDDIHIECKRVESLNIGQAVEQAVKDAAPGCVPTVFHRKNRKPWLVTLQLDDVEAFVEAMLVTINKKEELDERNCDM